MVKFSNHYRLLDVRFLPLSLSATATMKINDVVFRYKTSSISGKDGICRFRTFVNSENQIFLLLTELDNNTSGSVTNNIEEIYDCLRNKGMLTTNASLIEHYESEGFGRESFDQVLLKDGDPSNTKWETLSKKTVISLINR